MSSSSSHNHTAESKGVIFARNFLAFALAMSLSLFSLFCCVRFAFVTPNSIVKIFANEQYVTALRNDVTDYAHDICRGSMLPEDTLDETISCEMLYDIVEAYISGAVSASQEFTKTTYEDTASELKKNMQTAIETVIKEQNLTVDSKQKNGAAELSGYVNDYILERIQIAHIDMLETVVNVGSIVSVIGMIVSVIISIVLILIIISVGEKRYRSVRYIVHSLNAAALINLSLILGVQIVKHFKSLVLYPTYVADAFLAYVDRCENAVGVSVIALFFAAFILTGIVWKLSRDSKK